MKPSLGRVVLVNVRSDVRRLRSNRAEATRRPPINAVSSTGVGASGVLNDCSASGSLRVGCIDQNSLMFECVSTTPERSERYPSLDDQRFPYRSTVAALRMIPRPGGRPVTRMPTGTSMSAVPGVIVIRAAVAAEANASEDRAARVSARTRIA
jgi:hypothetical protein